MGRAIVRDPQVFLFDEPLSNLDAKLRVPCAREIKALHQRLKTTTIYVTHDQIEAMTMADKIVVMHDGVVEQVGAPLELYDRPANLFVAGFIGSPAMNFLKGTVEPNGFRTTDGILLPMQSAPPTAAGRSSVYGVRPEHFILSENGVPVRVTVIEPTGSEMQIAGRLGSQEMIYVLRDRIKASPGDTIHIMPDPALIHIFDEQTGKRL